MTDKVSPSRIYVPIDIRMKVETGRRAGTYINRGVRLDKDGNLVANWKGMKLLVSLSTRLGVGKYTAIAVLEDTPTPSPKRGGRTGRRKKVE